MNRTFNFLLRSELWLCGALPALLLIGCDSSPQDGGGDAGKPNPDSRVDAVSSASPDVSEVLLDESHPGWRDADCRSCHETVHRSGHRVPDCVLCHGRNGAPDITTAHDGGDCAACHAAVHGGLDFGSPGACRACHHHEGMGECGSAETFDVVIIGAGGGGLAAAAALARAGKKIAVLERHYKVGGQMRVLERGDYKIELSLHGISGVSEELAVGELFEQLGIRDRIKSRRLDPLFEILCPDDAFIYPADPEAYLDVLKQSFPDEAKGLDRLFEELYHLSGLLDAWIVFQNTGQIPPDYTISDLAELQKLLNTSATDFVFGYVESQQLVGKLTALTVFMGKLPSEMSALTYLALWKGFHLDGVYYLEGGSESIVTALAEEIVENGGTIELQTEATEIVIDDLGRATHVRTRDGRCLHTRHVVSNASAPATLLEMVGEEYLPDDYTKRIKNMEIAPSMFVVYLGVDRDYVEEFRGGHELFVSDCDDEQTALSNILECRVEKIGFALMNYSAIDPTAAPAGKNVLTMTTILPYDCFDEWAWNTSRAAYRRQKQLVAEVLLEKAEQLLPDLSLHIEFMEIATPQSIRAFTLNPRGSILGWSDTLEQNILTRLEQRTPIPNLWLAGAWTFPGGGQQNVLSSGWTAAQGILASFEEVSHFH